MAIDKLEVARHIMKYCYWGNVGFDEYTIADKIDRDKFFAKTIFSSVFQNSRFITKDLSIFPDEWLVEFILDKEKRLNNFKPSYKAGFMLGRIKNLKNIYCKDLANE